MPDPPLHPNCRCTVQPVVAASVVLPEGRTDGDDGYIKGGFNFAGGQWMNNGRSLIDGPIWKKWCGENWGGGRDQRDPGAAGPVDPNPADSMDSACKHHDDCYGDRVEGYCDRRLLRELEALPADPRQWKTPPPTGDMQKAADFRKWAIRWFKSQIYRREAREQGYGEDLVTSP